MSPTGPEGKMERGFSSDVGGPGGLFYAFTEVVVLHARLDVE